MQAINIEAQCPAKINLTFDIMSCDTIRDTKNMLEGGYHEVETVYQAVSLYDQLAFCCRLDKSFAVKIKVAGRVPENFPLTQDNIIYKAAETFCRSLPELTNFDLEVVVRKNIPIGAGLGGASSNAVATLMALNTIFGEPFNFEELTAMSGTLGADVPFFLTGGLCLGTARGDKLKPLSSLPELWVVLVKPRKILIKSKLAYAQFDEYVYKHGVTGLPRPDWRAVVNGFDPFKLGNVFEAPMFERYPELAQLKEIMQSAGVICCHLTGSGSALYGLATSSEHARSIALSLNTGALDADIFIVQGIDHGVVLGGKGAKKDQIEQGSSQG